MSVTKRVAEAMAKLVRDDPNEALFNICAAVEATAKAEGRPGGKAAFKKLLNANMNLITAMTIRRTGRIKGLFLSWGRPDPALPPSPNGAYSLENIVYHVVRCGLYHASRMPGNLKFTDNLMGSTLDGTLLLPKYLILGIILAVVVSPANATAERVFPDHGNDYWIPLPWGEVHRLDELWGKRDAILGQLFGRRRKSPRCRRPER
jgi:hypothetical protein